jgi:hypothetical protein
MQGLQRVKAVRKLIHRGHVLQKKNAYRIPLSSNQAKFIKVDKFSSLRLKKAALAAFQILSQ